MILRLSLRYKLSELFPWGREVCRSSYAVILTATKFPLDDVCMLRGNVGLVHKCEWH